MYKRGTEVYCGECYFRDVISEMLLEHDVWRELFE